MADIVGTSGNNILVGTAATDTISGLGGNDNLSDDQGGDDTLDGGDGDDVLGVGRDSASTTPSNVTLIGGSGNDSLFAVGAMLTALLDGGSGNDQIFVNFGVTATVSGGDGDDVVTLILPVSATITLGAGSDRLVLFEANGTTLPASSYIVTDFVAGAGGDILSFSASGYSWLDTILIGWDSSNPWGSGGYLRATQSGADTLIQIDRDGGANSWTTLFVLSGVNAAALTAFNLEGYPPDGSPPAGMTINGTVNSENITGTIGGDVINGLDGNDNIYAGAGADTIFGGAGDDVINGWAQTDTISGEDGNDVIYLSGNDSGSGGAGNDIIFISDEGEANGTIMASGDAGEDYFSFGLSAMRNQSATVNGGADNDRFELLAGGATLTVNGDDGDDVFDMQRALADGTTNTTLNGGAGNDAFSYVGNHSGLIAFNGGTGDDRISLSSDSGSIQITLGIGQDVVDFRSTYNEAFESRSITITDFDAGNNGDRISFLPWLDRVLTNWDHAANPFSTGHLRVRNLSGNALLEIDRNGGGDNYQLFLTLQGTNANTLTAFNFYGYHPNGSAPVGETINGTPDNDVLSGGPGNDIINGLDGNDLIDGGAGDDLIDGGISSSDVITGGYGNDTILVADFASVEGGFGNDVLTATGSGSNLNGGAGDDILSAAGGYTTLTGGLGLDTINGSPDTDYIYVEDSDIIDGGGGGDVVVFDFRDLLAGIAVDLTNIASGGVGTLGSGTIQNIAYVGQTFYGSAYDDAITLGIIGNFGGGIEVLAGAGNDLVSGSQLDDLLRGDVGDDSLSGLDGNDDIEGADGNDILNGGLGRDTINGGIGNDIIDGGDDDDIIAGGDGSDQIDGGAGFDNIDSGNGVDTVRGGSGNDIINLRGAGSSAFGGSGADVISLYAPGNVDGGSEQDVLGIDFSTHGQAVYLNFSNLWAGGDIILAGYTITSIETVASGVMLTDFDDHIVMGSGNSFSFSINARGGNDIVIGSSTTDFLYGDDGNDVIVGGTGNDYLWGGSGSNELIGGAGDDNYHVDSATDSIVELSNGGTDTINTTLTSFTLPAFVEHLNASFGTPGFVGIGNALDNTIHGTSFRDTLVGGAGNDRLIGGSFTPTGADELIGGTGDDYYYVGDADSSVIELAGEGIDSVETILSFLALAANVENLTYSWGGVFTGVGNELDNVLTGQYGDHTLHGMGGNDILNGGGRTDVLLGGDGNDQMNGGLGQDQLFGGNGDDRLSGGGTGGGPFGSPAENAMLGGAGNDVYIVEVRGDSTIEYAGEGMDEVQTAFSIYGLQANIENLTLTDNATHLAAVGNELNNVIRGGTGRDDLFGREGNDFLFGGNGSANTLLGQEGDDVYVVTTAGDSVIEFAGQGEDWVVASTASFTLSANVENLRYDGAGAFTGIGNELGNRLTGNSGADFLSGLNGDDIIVGGSGADLLLGGNGSDEFRYIGGESGFDRILGFASGQDRIVLSQAGFSRTATVAFVSGTGAVANSANSTFLYDPTTGIVSYDADGNGAGAAVQLAQLDVGTAVVASDFTFI